jgi:hypothetical protein
MKLLIVAIVSLAVGILIGVFIGRSTLERQWSQPYATITPDQFKRSSTEKADPTPPASTKIVRPMPIGRARAALKSMTQSDPVKVAVVSEGSGDKGFDLHVVVENHGKCTVKEIAGVAYGFDALGRPAKMNYAGEAYVAFKGDLAKEPLEPGKHATIEQPLAYVDTATNGMGHVDAFTCTDGTSWRRQ